MKLIKLFKFPRILILIVFVFSLLFLTGESANAACSPDECGGGCGTGYHCSLKCCVKDACVPNCSGKSCGSNGCGGSCGSCSYPYSCSGNSCKVGPTQVLPSGSQSNPYGCRGNGNGCSDDTQCCSGSCGVDGKCFADVNQILNKTSCDTNYQCVPAYGWNCVDCSGIQGELPHNCCQNCDDDNPPCPTAGPYVPQPTAPVCSGGCGIAGHITMGSNTIDPSNYGFYGWYNDGTQHSFYAQANADGNYAQNLTCGVHVFGGAHIVDSDKQNYELSPPGPYAYDETSLQCENWDFTLTAPTPTPTDGMPRLRACMFEDDNENGYKEAGENCINTPLLDLNDDGGNYFMTSSLTNNNCSGTNTKNLTFGQISNGYYEVVMPTIAGKQLAQCSHINNNKGTIPSNSFPVGQYYFCETGQGLLRLKWWNGINSTGYVNTDQTDTAFELTGENIDVCLPMVAIPPTSTPTLTSTPTPTATPTPGAWKQILGGDTYQPSISALLPGNGSYYLDNLSGQNKSAGLLVAQNPGSGLQISIYPDDHSSRTGWKATANLSNTYGYDYYKNQLTRDTSIVEDNQAGSDTITGSVVGGKNIKSYSGNASYKTGNVGGGDFTVNTASTPVFYVINGNFIINNNITVTSSTRPAVFIVNGSITIDDSVSTLYGVYIATGNVVFTAGRTTTLNTFGMIYADGLNEAADVISNGSLPTYKFTYKPEYLLSLIPYLGKTQVNWQEVAP